MTFGNCQSNFYCKNPVSKLFNEEEKKHKDGADFLKSSSDIKRLNLINRFIYQKDNFSSFSNLYNLCILIGLLKYIHRFASHHSHVKWSL